MQKNIRLQHTSRFLFLTHQRVTVSTHVTNFPNKFSDSLWALNLAQFFVTINYSPWEGRCLGNWSTSSFPLLVWHRESFIWRWETSKRQRNEDHWRLTTVGGLVRGMEEVRAGPPRPTRERVNVSVHWRLPSRVCDSILHIPIYTHIYSYICTTYVHTYIYS